LATPRRIKDYTCKKKKGGHCVLDNWKLTLAHGLPTLSLAHCCARCTLTPRRWHAAAPRPGRCRRGPRRASRAVRAALRGDPPRQRRNGLAAHVICTAWRAATVWATVCTPHMLRMHAAHARCTCTLHMHAAHRISWPRLGDAPLGHEQQVVIVDDGVKPVRDGEYGRVGEAAAHDALDHLDT
jgi:hypothetical protein